MSDPAIIVRDVSVRYRPYADRVPTARRSIARLRHRDQTEVVALDGVSCEIARGEAVGIIGSNGAGKSTLLRVMAGTLQPDTGSVEILGDPPTLLQLGVGFNPRLSGRDNVILGGLALGHSRARIDELMPDVIDFAEIGEAMERPVNTYSSGMRSRLAFAIATTMESEVLLLDELLAVGDAAFRDKSLAAMQNLVDEAGTVVLVSHSLSNVRRLCDSAIWLEAGRLRMAGPIDDVLSEYQSQERIDTDLLPDKPAEGWNAKQRSRVVRRVLAGEKPADIANETGLGTDDIVGWRRRFLEGGKRALRPRFDSEDDD